MNRLFPRRRWLRLLPSLLMCGLIRTVNVAGAAAPSEEAHPWLFPEPLRSDALFAEGYAAPWLSPSSAWVSADGKRVAFFTREPASAEGISRALVIKDVDKDEVISERTLFTEEESLRYGGALTRLAKSRAQDILTANPQDRWVPLAHQDLSDHEREFFSDACFEKQLHPKRSTLVGSLKITYQEPRVQIWRRGKKLLDRQTPSWRVKQDPCPHASPSWLNRVFGDAIRGVVLLELGFCGVDLCPEPATAFHVLRVPPEQPREATPSDPRPLAAPTGPFVHHETARDVWKSLYVTGFPAISKDGSQVALAEREESESSTPNLRLTIRQAQTPEVLWRHSLLDSGESATAKRAAPQQKRQLDQKVLERIRSANERLRGTEWLFMEEKAVRPVAPERCPVGPQTLKLKEAEMTFQQGHIILKRHDKGEPLKLSVSVGSTENKACNMLQRAFIDAAYANSSENTVILRLSTCVDDECPQRTNVDYVFQLPE
ncbi:hypothetical protein [Melittangium boletus]|uniref:hypothetical protein n=1 Tax=Melittangium boletus TaxID=83453 RepID=UPI003DA5E930